MVSGGVSLGLRLFSDSEHFTSTQSPQSSLLPANTRQYPLLFGSFLTDWTCTILCQRALPWAPSGSDLRQDHPFASHLEGGHGISLRDLPSGTLRCTLYGGSKAAL